MLFPPKTKAEAAAHRYNRWGGNSKGTPFNPACCAWESIGSERGALPWQCRRKPGHGPENIYCKQHAKMAGGRIEATAEREKQGY